MGGTANSRNRLIVLAVLLVALVVAVLVATVGGGDDEGGGESSSEVSTDLSSKPDVPVPDGEPPQELEVVDVVEGDGAEAKSGDTVAMQYVGVNYSNGEEFDSSWERGEPFTFQLGSGQVIPGWDEGIEGMKVGGRRELVIPPDLGYGQAGSPPDIPPDETLIFVVDLVDVQSGS